MIFGKVELKANRLKPKKRGITGYKYKKYDSDKVKRQGKISTTRTLGIKKPDKKAFRLYDAKNAIENKAALIATYEKLKQQVKKYPHNRFIAARFK
jgi:hypothetical protein